MRVGSQIDRTFTNLKDTVKSCGTVSPLEPDLPDEGTPSNHRVSYLCCAIPHVRTFKWLLYSYRYFNEGSVDAFQTWVVLHEWSEVLIGSTTSQDKALAYQRLINQAVNDCCPLITMRRKTTDPPWINARLRRLMRRRKAVYSDHGRSREWR